MTQPAPIDWDLESHCVRNDCMNPACHRVLESMAGDTPVYGMVCCDHAGKVAS